MMTFLEILRQYNIPLAPRDHHHRRPQWENLDCPWCGKNSRRYHLGYSLRGNFANCWKCGAHSLPSVVKELTDLPYPEVFKLLDGMEKVKAPEEEDVRGHLVMPSGQVDLQPTHLSYLRRRGYDVEEVTRLWRITGLGLNAGRLSWRIFIPIIYRSEVVSWTTRSVSDTVENRYLSASPEQEKLDHKKLLYGEDYCRHACIVCEGPFDVWRVGPGAVCTFGTAYTRAQVARMAAYSVRAICLDSEPVAQRRGRALAQLLAGFPGQTLLVELDAKDPGVASADQIKSLREAVGLGEYK